MRPTCSEPCCGCYRCMPKNTKACSDLHGNVLLFVNLDVVSLLKKLYLMETASIYYLFFLFLTNTDPPHS